MTKNNSKIGEQFVSKEGCNFIIVEYNNYKDVVIEFKDVNRVRVRTRYDRCKSGEIKNPYHKSICEVACLGLMSDGSKPKTKINGKCTREYTLWSSMVHRCYSKKLTKNNPSYTNCAICERWLCFANFLNDLTLIEGYDLWVNNKGKYSLDKDVKQPNFKNKIYSLETCCFILIEENSRESSIRNGLGTK